MKLTNIEIFKSLSRVELAKLLGMLERQHLQAGRVLFRQGDPGDSMYIVERGRLELYVDEGEPGDPARVRIREKSGGQQIAVIGEGDVLGEMALLTGEPRSAAAVAVSECMLYVLDRTTFDRLTAENPVFTSYFIKLLSQRLIATNSRLKQAQAGEEERLAHELNRLRPEWARFLIWCAALPVVTPSLVRYIHGEGLMAVLEEEPSLNHYFAEAGDGPARLRLKPGVAERMAAVGRERWSEEERQAWAAQAAAYYESEGGWSDAVELWSGLGQWKAALDTYERGVAVLPRDEQSSLHEAVRRCPAEHVSGRYSVLQAYLPYCEARCPEEGLAVLELALRGGHRMPPGGLSFLYERGMELCRQTGRLWQAVEYMRLAEHAAESGREGASDARSLGFARQKLLRARSEQLARGMGGLSALGGTRTVYKAAAVAAAMLCAGLSFVLEPAGGLSEPGMRFVGIAVAAVLLWVANVIPDYVVALGMTMAWVLGGVAAPETALSGYSTDTWLYMIGIMAMSAVITKSGISYRFALHALKRFPANYRGQVWGIVAGGVLMGPLLPSSSAKVSIGVPMAQTLAESMGFRDRSRGAAGLGLVAMTFFGFTAPFMLTGSYTNVMAYGLAAKEQPVSWLLWLLYALPALLLFSLVMLGLLLRMFRGVKPPKRISGKVLEEQLALLGPLSREEKIVLSTVLGCVVLMILEPWHGVAAAWIMLAGFSVLVVSRVLDKVTLSSGIDWTFLLFLGAAFSFAAVAEEHDIAGLLASYVGGPLSVLLASPALFLAAVTLISFAVTLIIRDDPAVILLVTAIVPLGNAAGIHPWVIVFIILLATDPFFFSYQSPTYLTAYYSAEGKSFSHRQGSLVGLGYGVAVLLIAVLCTPYWKWLGLIP